MVILRSMNWNPGGSTPITGIRVAIQQNAAPENRAISPEPRFPISIRQDHRAFAFRVFVGGGEPASERRLHTQQRQESGLSPTAPEPPPAGQPCHRPGVAVHIPTC